MRLPTTGVRCIAVGLGIWGGVVSITGARQARAEPGQPSSATVALGKQLFHRKFIPNDPRCHGGDGLGPVYNESSCVACHNLGGSGGAGSNARNVELVAPTVMGGSCKPEETGRFLGDLVPRETNLPSAGSNVLHRFGSRHEYKTWHEWLLNKQFEGFALNRTQRSTPSLFGAGLIDAIPESVVKEAALRRFDQFPEIKGRVCRLKDGRIGRFGWKGQMASLDDFVLTACSVELGLEVPGHHQSKDPSGKSSSVAELDLTPGECFALVSYVRALPAPAEVHPPSKSKNEQVLKGGALFKTIGCATCHSPTLGEVDGIYSDLLLHDMGAESADNGFYSSSPGDVIEPPDSLADLTDPSLKALKETIGATRLEWRTPPLWGLRDSAPYLHDGRAKTLDEAIAKHGGEAAESKARYARLSGADQVKVRAFLWSIGAPQGED
jgi:CxxC motif-containing protein (DUF1111 family)